MIRVFGATGNFGHELVWLLAVQQIAMRTFARNPQTLTASPYIQPIAGDITNPVDVQSALAGVTSLFC